MKKKISVYSPPNINPFEKQVDVESLRRNTTRDLVVRINKVPTGVNLDNPDPCHPFMGKDGNWYKIIAPKSVYNCYLFAMGWIINAPNTGYGIPGFMTGKTPQNSEDFLNFIADDLAAVGRKTYELYHSNEIPETLPPASPNTYWVKVYFKNIEDLSTYHISRKDEVSGRWIHKLGWTAPCKVICENLEFGQLTGELLDLYPHLREVVEKIPKQYLDCYLKNIKLPPVLGITRSRWESRDNAPYFAYNPVTNPDKFIEYHPGWVLRIDK